MIEEELRAFREKVKEKEVCPAEKEKKIDYNFIYRLLKDTPFFSTFLKGGSYD